jgi:type II secretory pathway pseudopilin PulG
VERIKKKGVALIAVIVTIVLFTSLILAVVLAATMSIRRANYYKDKLIALEIAENGLQKILYNLNYYGYQENKGTGWSKASWIGSNFKSSSFSLPEWYSVLIRSKGFTENDLTKYETEISLPEYGGKGKYTLYFIDANSQTASETDLDLIVAKGSYGGRTSTISFLLRGAGEIQRDNSGNYFYGDFKNSLGVQPVKNPNRTLGSCGIPEAFNKHVISAVF